MLVLHEVLDQYCSSRPGSLRWAQFLVDSNGHAVVHAFQKYGGKILLRMGCEKQLICKELIF